MLRIGLLLCISFLATPICGQGIRPPVQITKFLSHDLVGPDEVKFRRRYNASLNWGFRLLCEATGSDLQWRWTHNGTNIVFGATYKLGVDGSLTGEFLEAENSGNYQCFVKDTITHKETFSRKLEVAVTYVGNFTNHLDVVLTIDLGKPFSIKCPAHAPNYGASYKWLSSDHLSLKPDSHRAISPSSGELSFMYVTQDDVHEIGELNGIGCAIFGANYVYVSGIYTLKARLPVDPGTKQSPSWKEVPHSVEAATEGKNKTLYCLAFGRPPPKITWKKNGQRIIHGQNSFEIPDYFYGRLLIIANVKKDLHEDLYTCEAENSENMGRPLVYSTNLNVQVPPRWTGDSPPPTKKNIDIIGNGTLLCNVVADPVPSYSWYKNGMRIVASTSRIRVLESKLEFVNVRLQEDGVYQCVAENSLGMVVSSTWVNVRVMPPKFVEFGPFYLFEDREARLKCHPDAAPRPGEFKWYKGESQITTGVRHRVLLDGTLVIYKVQRKDAGQYRCLAKNFLGEASANTSAYVFDIPYPPTNLQLTDTCHNRTATLSWVATPSNNATISHFMVEQESNHEPSIFHLLYNVTNPNATSVTLNLTAWASLRFRMIAVTSLGLSNPSLTTKEGICTTSLAAPDKYPDNLRGDSTSYELSITWTPMPKIDWNAPGLFYILQYRKGKGEPQGVWKEENITDPSIGIFSVRGLGQCEHREFRIRVGNVVGLGPFSAIQKSFVVQHAPKGKPENVSVENITESSVQVAWMPVVDLIEGDIDGYKIYHWKGSRVVNETRQEGTIPKYATLTNVTGANSQQTTLHGLKPYTKYNLVIKAFSCGGEGPSSGEVTFSTMGSVSTGHPSKSPTASSVQPGHFFTTPSASSARSSHVFFSGFLTFVLAFSYM